MTVILKNNAFGFLQSAISNSDTTIVLQSGFGANFPNLGAGEYFYATVSPTAGASEIVKVVARSGDTLTIVRAQEGTSALSFPAGSRTELRVTAQSVIDAIADRVSLKDEASEISIVDAGNYYSSGNVEGALQEAALSSTTRFTQAGSGATTGSVQAKLREIVSVKDFGAVGDGVTDDSAAILAAITSQDVITFPPGEYLMLSQVTIPAANKTLIGSGGTIIRGTVIGGGSCFSASTVDNLTFENVNFAVQSTQPHAQVGGFILLDTCHNCRVLDCVFDAERKLALVNKESLFSAVNSPSCNRLLIQGNQFRYLFGNCCGAQDGVGNGVNGKNVSIVGNLFYNHVDTGIGCWTNSSNVAITGNVFRRDDYSTPYNGVSVDVAGSNNISIVGNSFQGNVIGVRMVSNIGYSNNRVLIEGNNFSDQVFGVLEPGTCIKVSHSSSSGISNSEDVIIRGNTFQVSASGVGIRAESTITDLTKFLTIQIDGNVFNLSAASATGVVFDRLPGAGRIDLVPGSNTFIGAGAGSAAVSGGLPSTSLTSQQNTSSYRTNFQLSVSAVTNVQSFFAERGAYSLAASVGTVVDGAGVGGLLEFAPLAGSAISPLSAGGNKIINAAASNSKWDQFFYVVPTDGDYKAQFSAHPAGNTINFHYLTVVRVV